MKISEYVIDLEKAIALINQNNYKKVVLQLPEGLKSKAFEIVDFLEDKTKANLSISADPCFGACDLDVASQSDADLVIQIGHLEIPSITKTSTPILFLNASYVFDVKKLVNKVISKLKFKKIGLVTTAQHIHAINEIKELFEEQDFEILIGKGDDRIAVDGQILGCNFSSATSIADRVDIFLFVGSGTFHSMGLILSTKKPVISVDPYTFEIKTNELVELKDMILKQRYGAIESSRDSKVFGILVGLKVGQNRVDLAYDLKKLIEEKQRKAYIIYANYFSADYLLSFRTIDCFISTSCPRIAIDDYTLYKTPILTPIELEILLGCKKWEDFQFDEIY